MKKIKIIGINVLDRIKASNQVQSALSEFASLIETRLGFHELTPEISSRKAFIILKLKGSTREWEKFENRLGEIRGIEVKTMDFRY
ncbi:MAG: hypothetical protein ACLFNJ_01010 [Bacteroidales bacterium]